ncbi:inositol monophosphatase family protein, partial [Patescibacteria group bacterium]
HSASQSSLGMKRKMLKKKQKNNFSETTEFTIKLAEKAGKILMDDFGESHKAQEKGRFGYVTDTDLKSEKLILSEIKKKYPDHDYLSEEAGGNPRHSNIRWIIDPLDGTNNHFFGFPAFAVSIALEKDNQIQSGVTHLPYCNWTFVAERGKGAFLNGKPIKVAESGMERLPFLCDTRLKWAKESRLGDLDRLVDHTLNIRMFGSTTQNLSFIASGSAGVFIERATKPWDIAVGCLLVEEAGGKVTDFEGRPWSIYMKNLVASNSKIHKIVLDLLNNKNI